MKKIFKILWVVFLLAICCNIGYYMEQNHYEAEVKYLNGEKAELNIWEKITLGPDYSFAPVGSVKIERTDFVIRGLAILLCPGVAIMLLGAWLIKGIIICALALWWVMVWIFKFIFCGRFFKLIGLDGALVAIWFAIIIFVIRKMFRTPSRDDKKTRKNTKKKR